MTRRVKIWLVVAVLFAVLNLAGGVYAAMMREPLHASAHFAAMLLGVYVAWTLASGARARDGEGMRTAEAPGELDGRLTDLERSIDAVAIEIERVGEGQRFMTRLFTDEGAKPDAVKPARIDPTTPIPGNGGR